MPCANGGLYPASACGALQVLGEKGVETWGDLWYGVRVLGVCGASHRTWLPGGTLSGVTVRRMASGCEEGCNPLCNPLRVRVHTYLTGVLCGWQCADACSSCVVAANGCPSCWYSVQNAHDSYANWSIDR